MKGPLLNIQSIHSGCMESSIEVGDGEFEHNCGFILPAQDRSGHLFFFILTMIEANSYP